MRIRAHDGRDELLGDLQAAGFELGETDDRGVAGAEVIDFDVDPERLDLIDGLREAVVAFIEVDRFDKFERQHPRFDVQIAQAPQQSFVVQSPQRNVDGEPRHAKADVPPATELRQPQFEDRSVNGPDDRQLFGDVDELGGRDDAAGGMTPAGERFHACQFVGSRIELRLVIGDEFAALQPFDDAVRGLLGVQDLGLQRSGVEFKSISAQALGAIERKIRVDEQALPIDGGAEGAGDADARARGRHSWPWWRTGLRTSR